MSRDTEKTSEEEKKDDEVEEEEQENDECDEENDEENEEENDEEEDGCAIDLSQNEIYRGICTLLEDEQGHNILEYISLLHTELIGINTSMENLKGIKKELTRLADIAELMVKGKKDVQSSSSSVVSSAPSHHDKSEKSKKEKVKG